MVTDDFGELGAEFPGSLVVSVVELHVLLADVEARRIFHTLELLHHLAAHASQVTLIGTDRLTTPLDRIVLDGMALSEEALVEVAGEVLDRVSLLDGIPVGGIHHQLHLVAYNKTYS